jgi:NADPH-ferrihemoprotein reductase
LCLNNSFVFVEDAQKKTPFPCPCSYRTALKYYLDLTSMPNTQVLKDLAQYVTDENEKALLTLMGSYSEEGKVKTKILFCFYSIYIN